MVSFNSYVKLPEGSQKLKPSSNLKNPANKIISQPPLAYHRAWPQQQPCTAQRHHCPLGLRVGNRPGVGAKKADFVVIFVDFPITLW